MYAFLRTPRWLAGIVLAAAVIVAFTNLGLWQLRRLDERRAHNATIAARIDQPPADLAALAATAGADGTDAVAYRPVEASGTYAPGEEVLWAARSRDGQPGHHVLTPLVTDVGVLIVDRGWVPFELDEPPVAPAAPPDGDVTVRGVALEGRPGSGDNATLLRTVDLERLDGEIEGDVLPFFLSLREQSPAQPQELPVAPRPPEQGEGNHLSYAIQWFLFAAVVAVGFPLLVRHTAHSA